MANIAAIDQAECVQAIDIIINASCVLIAVLTIIALVLGFLIGDAYQFYKARKQRETEYYCPCCDYPVSEENKGRGI